MEASFNQLHNWKQTSEYWNCINNLPDSKRNLDIRYKYKDTTRTSPYINVLWHYISKEFISNFGSEFKMHEHFDLFTRAKVDNCHKYPSVYIHTSICSCLDYEISFDVYGFGLHNTRFGFTPKSNQKITREFVINEVFKYIEKNLFYAEGYFKDLQTLNSWNKKQVKDNYRYYIKNREDVDPYNYDLEKYFTRKYGIVPSDTISTDWNKFAIFCADYISKNGKPKEVQTVRKFNCFSGIYDIEGDIEEIEGVFWDAVADYPENTILI